MDINVITQLLATFGFPVVACGALFWFIVAKLERFIKAVNELTLAQTRLEMKIDELLEVFRKEEGL